MSRLRKFGAHFQRLQGYTSLPAFSRSQFNFSQDSLSPSKIFVQIILLQCFYYITAGVFSFLLAVLLGLEFTFGWIFSWTFVTLDNTLGWAMVGLWLFDSFICVIFMTVIVGRSKLAWDFALTIHAINVVVVWIYTGEFPTGLVWWSVQVLSSIILVSLGTWTTRWKELRETFFEGLVDPESAIAPPQRPVIEMHDMSENHDEQSGEV